MNIENNFNFALLQNPGIVLKGELIINLITTNITKNFRYFLIYLIYLCYLFFANFKKDSKNLLILKV